MPLPQAAVIFSTKIDTTKSEFGFASAGTNSLHGTTPTIDRLIAR